jgi:hypothetical protein
MVCKAQRDKNAVEFLQFQNGQLLPGHTPPSHPPHSRNYFMYDLSSAAPHNSLGVRMWLELVPGVPIPLVLLRVIGSLWQNCD